jgi:hypothetical protein
MRLSQAGLKKSMKKILSILAILLVFASIACVSGVEYSANVIAEDTLPPIVTDPSANLSLIAADGIQESQLNVTVTDESGIYSVTVDLSVLGGQGAKEMVKIDDTEVYTITTTAAIGTPPGTYALPVTATDNSTNRNSNTSVSILLTVTAPVPETYAIWANSTKGNAIQWSGSRNRVNGKVHSNNDIKVGGSSNIINGTTEYVSTFTDSGSNNTYIPPPIKVSPEPSPVQYSIEDYKPGGKEAIAAGDRYHHIEGNFHISGSDVVLDGLYYVEGNVKLSGSNISGVFTLVAEGKIDVSGSKHNCSAYSGNLLFFSNNTKFKIAGGKSYFGGIIYTPKGEIELFGSGNTINGSFFADTVKLSGSELNINAVHFKSTVETAQASGDDINIFVKALKAILQFFRVQ